jgi:FtsH-binding integral membrane protein
MDQRPDLPGRKRTQRRTPVWPAWLLTTNLEQALRWISWAWIAGLAWWVWSTGLLLVWLIAGIDPQEQSIPDFPIRIIIYQGVEGFLIGVLALGVNLRWRLAAALLPTVFFLARVIALTRLEKVDLSDVRAIWLVIYFLLFLLFVRGAQGAFSYYRLTHPTQPAPRL